MRKRYAIPLSIGLFLLTVGAVASGDMAFSPFPLDRWQIEAKERNAWGDIARQIDDMTVVSRGNYALVVTTIDSKNYAVFEKRNGSWARATPNGWGGRKTSALDLVRVGVPIETANALINGVRPAHIITDWISPGC